MILSAAFAFVASPDSYQDPVADTPLRTCSLKLGPAQHRKCFFDASSAYSDLKLKFRCNKHPRKNLQPRDRQ